MTVLLQPTFFHHQQDYYLVANNDLSLRAFPKHLKSSGLIDMCCSLFAFLKDLVGQICIKMVSLKKQGLLLHP